MIFYIEETYSAVDYVVTTWKKKALKKQKNIVGKEEITGNHHFLLFPQ